MIIYKKTYEYILSFFFQIWLKQDFTWIIQSRSHSVNRRYQRGENYVACLIIFFKNQGTILETQTLVWMLTLRQYLQKKKNE